MHHAPALLSQQGGEGGASKLAPSPTPGYFPTGAIDANCKKIRKVGPLRLPPFPRSGLLAAIVCFAVTPLARPANAQLKSFSTDHYVISFFPGAEGTAHRVAETAEEIFAPLAAAYDYYDDFAPIHILVLDNTDFGNGGADDYSNTVIIWASNLDWEIRGEHPWIRNVLTHEIAHVMTLDKTRKKWPFRFALISVSRFDANPDISFSFPLYYQNAPMWWVEGIAQYSPTKFGWDSWDSHRDMVLRMAVLEDDLHSYTEMGSLRHRGGGYRAEQVYNQGFALLMYIKDQYGAEKVESLQDHVGSLSFDPAIRSVLGISADQLYDDWVRYLRDHYDLQVAEIRNEGFFEGEPMDELNQGVIEYHPAYSPDGTKVAYISSRRQDFRIPNLVIYDFEKAKKKELKGFVDTRISWSPDGEEIVFLRNKNGFNDLYIYHLESEEEHRISANLRARDPSFSPDGERIAFARNEDGTTNLCLINRDGTGLVYLTNNNDGTQIYSPKWSPDGERILFSIFRGEDRDIAIMRSDSPPRPKQLKGIPLRGIRERKVVPESLKVFPDSLAFPDADTSGFEPLLASVYDERDPCWLADGSGFVFSSDRSGIFNIYRYLMETGEVEQLTNVTGGAFSPTVSEDGRVAYSSYHSNDFSLYEFKLDGYEREVRWDPLVVRDYQATYTGPRLSEEYSISRYRGRRVVDVVPVFQAGPTFVGHTFGLNQMSAGFQVSAGEILGSDRFVTWAIGGKNFREDTDFNTDFGVFLERRLRPSVANNRTFNPSFFMGYRRRETDFTIAGRQVDTDTLGVGSIIVAVDSTNLLLPDVTQLQVTADSFKDRFKDVFKNFFLGVDVPLTQTHQLFANYQYRDYDENWSLTRFRSQQQVFLIQDGLDVTSLLPTDLTSQDSVLVSVNDPAVRYEGLDFFSSHDLTLAWTYRRVKPTADRAINPLGRSAVVIYRYMKSTVADSLAILGVSANGSPSDLLAPDKRQTTVNEYIANYTEAVGLPANNAVSLQVLAGFKNIQLKPGSVPNGGFFEGRFYWPFRYYLGGRNFLSGYPYFTASGSKLAYGRLSYRFPLARRLSTSFLNFSFTKAYAELFAETGAVGNFGDLNDVEFKTKSFLSDIGAEVQVQLFTFYRIPMRTFFQVAHPLNRNRERNWRVRDTRRRLGLGPNDPIPADQNPELIDRWRYYFGFTI